MLVRVGTRGSGARGKVEERHLPSPVSTDPERLLQNRTLFTHESCGSPEGSGRPTSPETLTVTFVGHVSIGGRFCFCSVWF